MVDLFRPLSQIKPQKILVVGDFVLDAYTVGQAKRISPEAPVPVLLVHHEERRPGMAGNVALNLVSLGMQVVVAGRVGRDFAGEMFLNTLSSEGVDTTAVLVEQEFQTPLKNRIIASNQQIVRVDHEKIQPLEAQSEQKIIEKITAVLGEIQLIAVSDYAKGSVTRSLIAFLVDAARKRSIPIVVDPKGIDFSKYSGVTVVKPNLVELYAAANLPFDAPLDLAAQSVLNASKAQVLMVTRSEEGSSLFYSSGKREDFAVRSREVKDVTGAGDTVLAMLAAALANRLAFADAARLANVAAGLAIEKFGCARIALSEIAAALTPSKEVG